MIFIDFLFCNGVLETHTDTDVIYVGFCITSGFWDALIIFNYIVRIMIANVFDNLLLAILYSNENLRQLWLIVPESPRYMQMIVTADVNSESL